MNANNFKFIVSMITLCSMLGVSKVYAQSVGDLCVSQYQQKDYKIALAPCRDAAEQGLALAQFILGVSYAEGYGVARNYKQAVHWYRKAAEQGNAKAQYNLGLMYGKGQGVPQDFKQALHWLTKAAEQAASIGRAAKYRLNT